METTATTDVGGLSGIKAEGMRILAAVDESDGCLYAVKWVVDKLFVSLGEPVPQGNQKAGILTLLHVQTPLHSFVPVGAAAVYASTTITKAVEKEPKERAEMVMQRALQLCKDKNVTTETLVLHGDAKDIICQVTEKMQFDMLVIGSRGLSMIKRTFLGSVSDYCAHHAKCHVLIVKPPRESIDSSKDEKKSP